MKNIHVFATDKPSRIYLIKSINKLGITSNNPVFTKNFGGGTQNQHIYITSDEEIKVNDYITDGYLVWNWKDNSSLLGRKKIILTTDQDLIKDGVQAIDDEFLEWFVKNPSCEGVEVRDISMQHQDEDYHEDKIIIPKEEPKQEDCSCTDECLGYLSKMCKGIEELKQETLEETVNNFKKTDVYINEIKQEHKRTYSEKEMDDAYDKGFKDAIERSYSEEEVLVLLHKRDAYNFKTNAQSLLDWETPKEWLEQFKNK